MSQIYIPVILGKPSQEIYRILPDVRTVALRSRRGVIEHDRTLIEAHLTELKQDKTTRSMFEQYQVPSTLFLLRNFDYTYLQEVKEDDHLDLAIKAVRGLTPLKPEEQRKLANWVFRDGGEIKPLAQFSSLASMALKATEQRQELVDHLTHMQPYAQRSSIHYAGRGYW